MVETEMETKLKMFIQSSVTRLPADVQREGQALLDELTRERRTLSQTENIIMTLLARYGSSVPAKQERSQLAFPPSSEDDNRTSRERGNLVRETALDLVKRGKLVFSTKEVVAELAQKGIRFNVKRPTSLVGSVLRAMPQFRKEKRDRYVYLGTGHASLKPSDAVEEVK